MVFTLFAVSFMPILAGCSQSQAVSAQQGEVVYVFQDIKKGETITERDLEIEKVPLAAIPPDAVVKKVAVGKKTAEDLKSGMILSMRDIGIVLTDADLKRLQVNQGGALKNPAPIVVAARDLSAGQKLDGTECKKIDTEIETIPMDALFETSQAAGQTCKFDIKAGEVLMQHELRE